MDGQEFKDARIALGLTQKALAAEFGMSEVTIQNYESGRSAVPTLAALAIAELARRRIESAHGKPKSIEAWQAEWSNAAAVERIAFEKMVRARPVELFLLDPSPDDFIAAQKWERFCDAWLKARENLAKIKHEHQETHRLYS